jgi:cell division septum initiation protein DivIVA
MIDTGELKRMITNSDGDIRVYLRNVVKGINALQNEVATLKAENARLQEQIDGGKES